MAAFASPSPDSTSEKPPPPRRWIPVSFRMFASMLVLLGVGSALWVGVPACRQHTSIREIERVGGKVVTRARGPKWLRAWVGNARMKPFDEVVTVMLKDSRASDATLHHLTGLTHVQSLKLANTRVTDTGLMHLSGLTRLNDLELANTQVTDAGLAHVKKLTTLRGLNLRGTRVTDVGLAHLNGLTNLKGLCVKNTRVTADGLTELRRAVPELSTDSGPDQPGGAVFENRHP